MIAQLVDGLQLRPARTDHRRIAGNHRRCGGTEEIITDKVRSIDIDHPGIVQFAICNLQFPICNKELPCPQPFQPNPHKRRTSAASARSSARLSTSSSRKSTAAHLQCRQGRERAQGNQARSHRRSAAAPRRRPGPLRGPGQHRRHGPRHGMHRYRRPVKVPVGKATLGRVFNLIGEPIDGRGPVKADDYWPIHRDAPPLTDLRPRPSCSRPASR